MSAVFTIRPAGTTRAPGDRVVQRSTPAYLQNSIRLLSFCDRNRQERAYIKATSSESGNKLRRKYGLKEFELRDLVGLDFDY